MRYFTSGFACTIMLIRGVSYGSVYPSVWGVADAVIFSKELELEFSFPNHEVQRKITASFCQKIGAMFNNVVGAINCLLIWIIKLSFSWCRFAKCGEGEFKFHRKGKFGMNS